MEYIYLDYNATTPVDYRVSEAIKPFFEDSFGNASSNYTMGIEAKKAVDNAKNNIAKLIGADSKDIFFTSGATESINLALKGLALHYSNTKKHIITCQTEHKAVLETCVYLESIGYRIQYLPVDRNGSIDLTELKTSITDDTLLVCLMWVNNETGVIHQIQDIGAITSESGCYFVCDATQGVGKLPIDVKEARVDIACFSAHKIYATKGIGGIFIDHSILKQKSLLPLIHGGGQQEGIRSGTYNVPLIAGLGKACEIAYEEMEMNRKYISSLQQYLEKKLLDIEGTIINNAVKSDRIYNVINACIPNFDTEIFIGMNPDIAVSNGSSCNASLIQPSHVLLAMGLTNEQAMASIRISFGKNTTVEDFDILIDRINQFINL